MKPQHNSSSFCSNRRCAVTAKTRQLWAVVGDKDAHFCISTASRLRLHGSPQFALSILLFLKARNSWQPGFSPCPATDSRQAAAQPAPPRPLPACPAPKPRAPPLPAARPDRGKPAEPAPGPSPLYIPAGRPGCGITPRSSPAAAQGAAIPGSRGTGLRSSRSGLRGDGRFPSEEGAGPALRLAAAPARHSV